jgi:hypothetical protein
MKIKLFIIGLSAMLWSCGQGTSSTENESTTTSSSESEVSIDMDGPIIEANVLRFSEENSRTEIEVINRSDAALTSVSMRLVFIDADGNEITTATGRRKDSLFQTARNPHVVDARSRDLITAMNKIEPGTASIKIEALKGQNASGESIDFD